MALAGAVLLIALYISTLVFALMDSAASVELLKASVAATILLPVLLYMYTLFSDRFHRDDPEE